MTKKTHEQRALENSLNDLQTMVDNPSDYGIDDMTVAALETGIECIKLRLESLSKES